MLSTPAMAHEMTDISSVNAILGWLINLQLYALQKGDDNVAKVNHKKLRYE